MPDIKVSKEKYDQMVKEVSPNSPIFLNCIKAFVVGGFICCIGQFIINSFVEMGYSLRDAQLAESIILVFLSAFFTGLGLYSKFGKFSGAGTIVPITGFANSVAAPAIEFKKEGMVFGLGAKMFVVAGPVIVYGTLTSFIVGIIYYIFSKVA
ncbi:MAG: stage V sporulation protein AC [Lachnospiraceae bacterium]|nr:stage V sporulation protein AC [Lachnospiraceae bacterium]